MPVDLDLAIRAGMDAFASPAVLTPANSQPGQAAYLIRGVFAMKGADIVADDGSIVRADNYTFGVRASEFEVLPTRGDLLSEIVHPSFQRFVDGKVFMIEDTGDDGQGHQSWILKEVRAEDDEP